MNAIKVHILYEYGSDMRPHASSFVRLLRPLTHPLLRDRVLVSHGLNYYEEDVDVVILDRLWRPDVRPDLAEKLLETIRRNNVKVVYCVDDNLLDLPEERADWPKEHHLQVFRLFLTEADKVVVTTEALRERLSSFNSNIMVMYNALDERLLLGGRLPPVQPWIGNTKTVIGYMGTRTHDEDLKIVLPALRTLWERYPEQVRFEVLGVLADTKSASMFSEIPVRFIGPPQPEAEYPLFMLWFTSRVKWDIAISPLRDSPVTRCKSHIKYLDYAAIGSAGIYSVSPAYTGSVKHMETGWLATNEHEAWLEALERLFIDKPLRERLAYNAGHDLYGNHVLARRADMWLQAFDRRSGLL
ncbi:MAG: hypothetical protein ACC700_15005 [Anaerolineales bacterium]